jgi:hypothetical protein
VSDSQRRATDQLELTEAQRAFLDQVIVSVTGAVSEAIQLHEDTQHAHLLEAAAIADVVEMAIAEVDLQGMPTLLRKEHDRFEAEVHELKIGHNDLELRHDQLDRNVDRIMDVVVGPVKTTFLGDAHPDGERDETQGLMARTEVAFNAAEKLDRHLTNGGVPVKLPTNIKAAIWGAAGTVVAATLTTLGIIVAAFVR